MHRRAARQADRGGPQRVVGRRHQHLVAGVEQRVHAHDDQFRGAVAEVDVVDGDAGDVLLLGVMHDRLARREQALGVGVAGRIAHVAYHVLHDLVRRVETEGRQVADVELDDLVTILFHLARLLQHGATDVITDVCQFPGFLNRSHGTLPLK